MRAECRMLSRVAWVCSPTRRRCSCCLATRHVHMPNARLPSRKQQGTKKEKISERKRVVCHGHTLPRVSTHLSAKDGDKTTIIKWYQDIFGRKTPAQPASTDQYSDNKDQYPDSTDQYSDTSSTHHASTWQTSTETKAQQPIHLRVLNEPCRLTKHAHVRLACLDTLLDTRQADRLT